MAQTCRLYIGEEQFVWEVGRLWALVRDLIVEADMAYPLILSAEGVIMDGRHRLMKAWMLRWETVAVVCFPVNPPPDQRLPNAAADGTTCWLIATNRQTEPGSLGKAGTSVKR
jgi:hypothetical protein